MILAFLGSVVLTQARAADPVATIRTLVDPSVVQTVKDGQLLRITITHEGMVSAVASQSPTRGAAPSPVKVVTKEQFVLVPVSAPKLSDAKLEWLPSSRTYRTLHASMGTGMGYRWYGNATFGLLWALQRTFNLKGGDPSIPFAIQTLSQEDYQNSSDASVFLIRKGDEAVPALERASAKKTYVISVLATIRTPKAIAALVRMHKDPALRGMIETSFQYGKPAKEAKPIYVAGLSNPSAAPFCATTIASFGWSDQLPAIDKAYAAAQDPNAALDLLNARQKLRTGWALASYENVHNMSGTWSDHDTRALLTSPEPDYAPLAALKMISFATKGGRPFASRGFGIIDALRKSGKGANLDKMAARFRMQRELATRPGRR